MSSSQSNKLGQMHVEWYIKTQILRYKVLGGLRPPKKTVKKGDIVH